MTLCVDVFVVDEDGEMNILDVPTDSEDAAGFESWRTVVWGSDAVRALGARYFVVLSGGDLTVAPEEIADFLKECMMLRANLDRISPRGDVDKSHADYVVQVSRRLANIEAAVARAAQVNGGIIVW